MLKTIFFTLLVHLGMLNKQEAWVNQINPERLARSLQIGEVRREVASLVPHEIQQALNKDQGKGFPGAIWKAAAKAQGVDPVLLYSVALVESARQTSWHKVGPRPFALHFNEADVSIYASSNREARFVLAHVTTDNVDIGLGQVNYKSHKDKVHRPEDLLDPKTNLMVASQILAEGLRSTPDLELGVGRYHSWTQWRARAYGRRVLTIYRVLKEFVGKDEAASGRPQPPRG